MSKKKGSQKRKDEPAAATEAGRASAAPGKLPVIIALAGLAVLAFVLLSTESPQSEPARIPTLTELDRWQAAPEVPLSLSPDRIVARGPEGAPVTIVTFSDFECPYCEDASGVIETIVDRFPDQVRLVFKNYPLDMACNEYVPRQVHTYACRAAAMARCAGAQDRFWDMHDAIFALDALSVSALDSLPGELGLSEEAFDACVTADETAAALRADIDEGNKLGVQSTPAIFVNGKRAPSFRATGLIPIVEHILAEGS